jgi:hypothetical protein
VVVRQKKDFKNKLKELHEDTKPKEEDANHGKGLKIFRLKDFRALPETVSALSQT